MQSVRFAAFGAFGFSVLSLVLFLQDMFAPFLGAAISLAVAGILLMALDRVLQLLTEIRDALRGKTNAQSEVVIETTGDVQAAPAVPRTASEIAADIRRMGGESR